MEHVAALDAIGHLPALHALCIDSTTSVTSLKRLSQLRLLTGLWLDGLMAVLDAIGKLPALQVLWCTGISSICSLEPLSQLSSSCQP
jgi:hypothetical protein